MSLLSYNVLINKVVLYNTKEGSQSQHVLFYMQVVRRRKAASIRAPHGVHIGLNGERGKYNLMVLLQFSVESNVY